MTYYAVTNDPNELMHFGILGMKWGVRRTPEQLGHPRHTGSGRRKHTSPAYKKAQAKLSKSMQNGIQKVEAKWHEYNSPANRYERQTNRALQKARKGKLKYGKLTDDQVYRIRERLALERDARQLSETEKTFGKRIRESIGEGVISGIGQGFGRRASEFIARGSILKTDRLRAEQQEALDRRKENRRLKNARREQEEKLEREFENKVRTDKYEHERDRKYLEEKTRNAYKYGVKYDSDGKLSGDSYEKLYGSSSKEGIADAKQKAKNKRRESERLARERERQTRIVTNAAAKLSSATQREQAERQRREQAIASQRERERFRSGMSELSREATRRDAERAWEKKQQRIASAQEKERFRSNVATLYGETGKHSKAAGPKLRFGAYDNPDQPTYRPHAGYNRKRPGGRKN